MLTVATINLRNRADRWRQRRHVLISALLDALPDLISLQEVYFPIRQGQWIRNQLNARMPDGATPYKLVLQRKNHPLYRSEGVGILSRLPILFTDWLGLGYGGRVALRANVELPMGETLDFVATHLHHISHDHEARHEQVLAIMGWLDDRKIAKQVIAGDFNELPAGLAIQRIKQMYHSAYESVHEFEPLATFPTALVSRPDGWAGCLDYIFLSPAVKAHSAHIFCNKSSPDDVTLYPSDHVGIIATIS